MSPFKDMVTVTDSPPNLGTEQAALQPSSFGPVSKYQTSEETVSDPPAKALCHAALGASEGPPAHADRSIRHGLDLEKKKTPSLGDLGDHF